MLGTVKSSGQTRLRARVRILGNTHTLIASSGNLVVNTWQHVAVTYDGERMRLYLDGVEVGVKVVNGVIDKDPNAVVAVGMQPGGTQFFDGKIDDIRVLQRALTVNELTLIVAGNNIPTAVADSFTVDEDSQLIVDGLLGVLANDFDPDSEPLSAVLQSNPEHGSVVLSDDGSFVYTPDVHYFGADSFTYSASDSTGVSEPAIVSITVQGTNDAPIAVNDVYQGEPDSQLVVNSGGHIGQ